MSALQQLIQDGFAVGLNTPFGSFNILFEGTANVAPLALFFAFSMFSGVSMLLWGSIGILRFLKEDLRPRPRRRTKASVALEEVAVIVPAHNEEVIVAATIDRLAAVIDRSQIYIGSDASKDRTVDIARAKKVTVADIQPNRGKAGVIAYMLEQNDLVRRYKVVMILDADTQLDKDFFTNALPFFDDPDIAVFGGHGVTRWRPHRWPRWSMLFTAYRIRLYTFMQVVFRCGQTWKYTNLSAIVPGFCALWRTSVISKLTVHAPGLVIEDFNLTFDLQRKRLGKIAYHPSAFGTSQDPHKLRDFMRQVRRWDLGLWQTIRRHGVWPSLFWLNLLLYFFETFLSGLILLTLPVLFVVFAISGFQPLLISPPFFSSVFELHFLDGFLGVFLADYLLTIIVTCVQRKPLLLVYGFFFLPLKMIDVYYALVTLPAGFFTQSQGSWQSPARSAVS